MEASHHLCRNRIRQSPEQLLGTGQECAAIVIAVEHDSICTQRSVQWHQLRLDIGFPLRPDWIAELVLMEVDDGRDCREFRYEAAQTGQIHR